MSDIVCRPGAGPKPLEPRISGEVLDWVNELRSIWDALGLSMNEFASMHPIDKGTISRYLSGQRVPRDRWFLDKLLAILTDRGKPVTPAVREYLTELHLRALQVAHPHEYRIRLINDELEIALTGKLEAERYARALEEQLAERSRQVQELTDDKGRLRAAWDADHAAMQADYERLTQEIDDIAGQLRLARERAMRAERRCRELEGFLDRMDTYAAADEDGASAPLEMRREFAAAHQAMERGTAFGWMTSVGPGFQISAPSRAICGLLGLKYEELNGSYLLADPLLGRLQTIMGNFGEWSLIIGMLTNSALAAWRSDSSYPHSAARVNNFFDWLNRYVTVNYEEVSAQVERAPAELVDGDSSRNELRQCLAAAVGKAEWPPFNSNRNNTMRVHIVSHPLLPTGVARFEKVAKPFYSGDQVIGYEVTWNAEHGDEVASKLIRLVLAGFGIGDGSITKTA